jgi:hypothetical protein
LISFFLVAWIAFPVSGMLGGSGIGGFSTPVLFTVLITLVGGFGVGYVSILANGCPFRQHVLAAQGTGDSMVYLAGFLSGAVIFHTVVTPVVGRVLL